MSNGDTSPESGLSEASKEALELIATYRYPDRDHPGIPSLVEHGAINPVALQTPGTAPWTIQDPGALVRTRLRKTSAELRRQAEALETLPELYDALVRLAKDEASYSQGLEYLANTGEANTSLQGAIASATIRVLTVHPSRLPRVKSELEARLPDDLANAENIAEWKEVYTRNHRQNGDLIAWAEEVAKRGLQARTTHEDQIERLYIIDNAAWILDSCKENGTERPALKIQVPALVAWLETYFRGLWERSERWIGEAQAKRGTTITTEHSRRILRLYSKDLRKTEVAKRLDTSTRYIDRQLAPVYEKTGLETIHGLCLWFAESEERHINP
ncbi:hypothetical protein OG897_08555 [Streptomyces sp. NBC_00237]|uniref:hypothetical protein n=1 Tax=Streptomyces sp. NBC_00237 TaxID=2975687 RepID=UPI002253D0A9|nr:hypothetical protein [Streptomyces sp. NBC_00237]MCX5201500.1 hypothetical protein [Streptomyces sp. NBC_00237]